MSADRQADFVRFMSHHLVALTGQYQSFNGDGTQLHRGFFGFSGFVIEFFDRWFWVTAGHCLKEFLDEPIRAGHLKVWNVGFADNFALEARHHDILPVTYEPGCGYYIEDPMAALDFGLIPLDDLQKQGMQKNKVIAVNRVNWIHQHSLVFSHYKMLGFPSHLITETRRSDGHVDGDLATAMITLDRLSPADVDNSPEGVWFVGQIPPDVTISSIKGMSGGPIYGFRQLDNGSWVYHVVALQSWWDEKRRIAYGCSLPYFAEALHSAAVDLLVTEDHSN
jgi:hypothetical protein